MLVLGADSSLVALILGIALTVLVSQLPALFGFTIQGDGLLIEARSFVAAVLAGGTNGASLALGVGTLLMFGLLRCSRRFPGVLLAVVAATVIVSVLNLATRFGVTVLGPLPRGLPALSIPSISTGDLVPVLLGGCAIALVVRRQRKLEEQFQMSLDNQFGANGLRAKCCWVHRLPTLQLMRGA